MADTAMWAATQVRDGADKLSAQAHEFVAGPKGSGRREIIDTLFTAPPAAERPSLNPIDTLAKMSDQTKQSGWVDERGNASISAPMSDTLGKAARWVEDKVGGTPADPEMLSTMDKAELRASIGTQVALAFVGAEEVKLLMNTIGASGAVRAIVESYRVKGEACFKDPALWSGVIGIALLMAGIKNTGAAAKLAAAASKYGWMVAAIPPLTQMCMDALDTKIVDDKERQARTKRNMAAALSIIKDVLLHKISQASGTAPPVSKPPAEGTASTAHQPALAAATPTIEPPLSAPEFKMPAKPTTAPRKEPESVKPLQGRTREATPKGVNANVELPPATPTSAPHEQPASTKPLPRFEPAPKAANESVELPPAKQATAPREQPASTQPLPTIEPTPTAANSDVELPPANENVLPLPISQVQEVPLQKAAGAENMSAGARQPPARDGFKLEVVASDAKDVGKSGGPSKGPGDDFAATAATTGPPASPSSVDASVTTDPPLKLGKIKDDKQRQHTYVLAETNENETTAKLLKKPGVKQQVLDGTMADPNPRLHKLVKALNGKSAGASLLNEKYDKPAMQDVVRQKVQAELDAGRGKALSGGGRQMTLDMGEPTGWVVDQDLNGVPTNKLRIDITKDGLWHFFPEN
ncbi:MAG: hypothetical protein H7Z19_20805 [Chitinophagaceae bacterium]|nr:hypothetical protein [Rubrivivax sp.]